MKFDKYIENGILKINENPKSLSEKYKYIETKVLNYQYGPENDKNHEYISRFSQLLAGEIYFHHFGDLVVKGKIEFSNRLHRLFQVMEGHLKRI